MSVEETVQPSAREEGYQKAFASSSGQASETSAPMKPITVQLKEALAERDEARALMQAYEGQASHALAQVAFLKSALDIAERQLHRMASLSITAIQDEVRRVSPEVRS